MSKNNLNRKITDLTLGLLLVNIVLTQSACASLIALPFQQYKCLPNNRKLTDIVSAQALDFNKVKRVTIRQTLNQLKAYCNQKGKLVDNKGKEIYFYDLTGCWGNPPANYREIFDNQNAELKKLTAIYNVIQMTCNTSGYPYP
jgi:hypothetical protein